MSEVFKGEYRTTLITGPADRPEPPRVEVCWLEKKGV
jgi:hypothetical protein